MVNFIKNQVALSLVKIAALIASLAVYVVGNGRVAIEIMERDTDWDWDCVLGGAVIFVCFIIIIFITPR